MHVDFFFFLLSANLLLHSGCKKNFMKYNCCCSHKDCPIFRTPTHNIVILNICFFYTCYLYCIKHPLDESGSILPYAVIGSFSFPLSPLGSKSTSQFLQSHFLRMPIVKHTTQIQLDVICSTFSTENPFSLLCVKWEVQSRGRLGKNGPWLCFFNLLSHWGPEWSHV